jgi:hypothetical protein
MDGLANLMGTLRPPRKLTIDGVEYEFRPADLRDYGEREDYVLGLTNPMALAGQLSSLKDSELRNGIIDKMVEYMLRPRFVTVHEDIDFEDSIHGLAYETWRALKYRDDVNDIRDALALIEKLGEERIPELREVLAASREQDLMGKSEASATEANRPRSATESTGLNDESDSIAGVKLSEDF